MPPKKKSAKLAKAATSKSPKFPKTTLEKALQIPFAIKDKNGGNPWEPEEIRQAVAVSQGNSWYPQTAASRDYGLTSGTRDAPPISLTELGREIVYAPNPETELALKKQAFLNIDIFKRVLEYYKGSNLPDMKYLGNVLTKQFGLDPETHEEFAKIFRENCQYLGITSGVPQATTPEGEEPSEPSAGTVTLAEGAARLKAYGVCHPSIRRARCETSKGIFPRSSSQPYYASRSIKGVRIYRQDSQPPRQ
jgi:hypothetical protein